MLRPAGTSIRTDATLLPPPVATMPRLPASATLLTSLLALLCACPKAVDAVDDAEHAPAAVEPEAGGAPGTGGAEGAVVLPSDGPACADPPEVGTLAADAQRIAVGRCRLLAGQPESALLTVDVLLDASPPSGMRPWAALLAAETRLAQGEPAAALVLLGGLDLPEGGAGAARVLLLRGRARIESGDLGGGKDDLNALLAGDLSRPGAVADPWGADPAEARWWLAEGALRRGAPEAAVGMWRTIWTHDPASPRAEEAAGLLRDAGEAVPDPATPAGRALILARAATLQGLQRHAEALALLDLLPADGDEAMGRLAAAAMSAREYLRAADLLGALADPAPQQRFDRALAISRTGDYAAAAALYAELAESDTSPSPPPAVDEASFKLGYLAWDAGDLDGAVALFEDHLARIPRSRHADEARWFSGWSLFRLGRYEQAQDALVELARRHPGSALAAAGRYWAARCAGLLGDAGAERAGLREVLERDPETAYAWFASARLGMTWAPLPEPAAPPKLFSDPALERGRALAEAGLSGWARDELAGLLGAARKEGGDAAIGLAGALAHAGDWRGARELVLPQCSDPQGQAGDPLAMRLCWPRPAGQRVSAAALEGGLDPNLPFAIMKAESGWDPRATSVAGARGIMQVMPALGEESHRRLHPGEPWDADSLWDPVVGSEIGTAELVSLRERLQGTGIDPVLPLVVAGYNGGEDAVRRWLLAWESPPEADVFVESISYAETRRYVRRVLGTLQVYRYVYGG